MHILIRAALYPVCIIVSSVFQVPDAAVVEDSSKFGSPNETSSEASSSADGSEEPAKDEMTMEIQASGNSSTFLAQGQASGNSGCSNYLAKPDGSEEPVKDERRTEIPDTAMVEDSSNSGWLKSILAWFSLSWILTLLGLSSEASSSVPDPAMEEDSSNFGWLDETSSEASSSGLQTTGDSHRRSMEANLVQRMEKCVKSVGMIALKNKDDDGSIYTATGWLVAKEESESYIMTNYHVISAIVRRKRETQREIKVVIQFDYLTKAQPSCPEFEVAQQAEISNADLDYAVLKVHSNCPGRDCLEVLTHLPNPNRNVTVIGHPETELKSCMFGKVLHIPSSSEKIRKWVEDKTKQYCPDEHCEGKETEVVCVHNLPAEKWEKLEKREDFLLIHNCGTRKGASGSPVVNDNGEVIALHSWGMFLGNKQQQEKPALEFAHSIKFIVEDIKKNNKALARKLNFIN